MRNTDGMKRAEAVGFPLFYILAGSLQANYLTFLSWDCLFLRGGKQGRKDAVEDFSNKISAHGQIAVAKEGEHLAVNG